MRDLLLRCIRFYQKNLSPMKGGPTCRFIPTCSQYALEAIEKSSAMAPFAVVRWPSGA